ncbi:ATP-dependent helicase HrpB [Nitratifractor salsuginis]|uniref:ATP-dependent helicase HrpB n=1 Tax=Nitratifractor salsuginis (strain DSM 16511 / JCM 12458 / E9I37-1) TaxID=749222 RepID=E6WYI0_NITSE|nr:ATP-dependent helicase HrpB [Nitratifractor salsuginis]ADV46492.1 ATP-dependent helicase HrpB [Nitratifractor salsuginis DSM 16511]
MKPLLPIYGVLPELKRALKAHNRVILQADPGAGKSTIVPLELLDEPWLAGKKILMLEPRRLAARAVATRMAETLNEKAGQRVGYRMRGESCTGPRTSIEVVTEGMLVRLMQEDPALEAVGLLIFDEFHERSLSADLGLALALQSQELLREDLRILIMSATLQSEELLHLLGPETPLVRSEGRSHEVSLHYLDATAPLVTPETLPRLTADTVKKALRKYKGSLLTFLPGAGEIHRCARALESLPDAVEVCPLYGGLSPEQQRQALRPAAEGRRKVILATNIAETSLTIDGIRIVVDGGYRREVFYDTTLGMERMRTRPIAADSARQRAGRAGRTAPGVCYRLWHRHRTLPPRSTPEILQADLTPLCLELARWGAEAEELAWIDSPSPERLAEANALLRRLEMLDEEGRITPLGERALKLGEHPRIAHMLLRAVELGFGYEGILLTLLLTERPSLGKGTDLRETLEALDTLLRRERSSLLRRRYESLLRLLDIEAKEAPDLEATGTLCALAYPERVAARREEGAGEYLSAAGRGLRLDPGDPLARHPLLGLAESSTVGKSGRILRAAPLSLEELKTLYPETLKWEEELRLDEASGRIEAWERLRFGRLVLEEKRLPKPESEKAAPLLLQEIRRQGILALAPSPKARRLIERVRCAGEQLGEAFPDWSEEALLDNLEEWLLPWMEGVTSLDELKALDLNAALKGYLGWERFQELEKLLPEFWTLPTGTRAPVDYSEPKAPALEARLQELLGETQTPRILEGSLPLTLRLLSPAGRPLAVTRDLVNFWQAIYPEVRKEMRGRYPKHYWPEDPLSARPTQKSKKAMDRQGL